MCKVHLARKAAVCAKAGVDAAACGRGGTAAALRAAVVQRQRAAVIDVDGGIEIDVVISVEREFVLGVGDVGIDVDVALVRACAVAGGDSHIARIQRRFNGRGFALVNGDIHRVNQPLATCGVDVQVLVDADRRSAGVDEVGFQCARSFGFAVLHVGNQEDFSVFFLQAVGLDGAGVGDYAA